MSTVTYRREDRIARIQLNRPDKLNAINDDMPRDLEAAVLRAGSDDRVHVIVLSGAGRSFCAGYDLSIYAEPPGATRGAQDMPWDPMVDYAIMGQNTERFMSLWRSAKPVVCKLRGHAIGGGSDIALCCDLIVASADAQIGYPPARTWGCPTTAMWVYRVGLEQAKRLLLTGEVISGTEAAAIGLVNSAVKDEELDFQVDRLALNIAGVPRNQLAIQKLVINQAIEAMGMRTIQVLATIMDGITRHTPEGVAFKRRSEEVGFKRAVTEFMHPREEPE